jgi:hypothetical protein
MKGPRLLKRYLAETEQRPRDLSRATAIDESLLSRWLSGERRPDLDNAIRLERHTRGKVPAAAWTSNAA